MAGCAGASKGSATPIDGGARLRLADNPALAQAGGSVAIDAGGQRLLVVNRGEGGYLALNRKCTHAGCSVRWDNATSQAACPCHGSRFSPDGAVQHGPAKKPLAVYAITVGDGVIDIAITSAEA